MIQSVACSQIGSVLIDSLLGGLASSIGFITIIASLQYFYRKYLEFKQRQRDYASKREHVDGYLRKMGVKK